ncbi:hypothetical protein LOTGIDRAFT_163069 [Lottia gigantea]|uniref:Uncharacterized protein n=1 Tax=Lottia gigantea TaxID=225164 RepID=V4AAG1_LOTGI|nr:hypothetical protein LOTGIDRAFT_163069 [Lottia gigantea]ESO92065.1 hypothetical protein LOTGIDRAFT_163069 [Lottia gigantea]
MLMATALCSVVQSQETSPLTRITTSQTVPPTTGSDTVTYHEGLGIAGLVLSVLSFIGVIILTVVTVCYFMVIRKKPKTKSIRALSKRNHESLREKASHLSELQITGTDLSTIPHESCNIRVGVGTLCQIVLGLFEEVVINLDNVRLKIRHSKQSLPIIPENHVDSPRGESSSVQFRLQKHLHTVFEGDLPKIDVFSKIAENILGATTVRQLMDAMFRVCRVARGVIKEWKVESEAFVGTVPADGSGYINFTIEDSVQKVNITWDDHKFAPEFLDAVSLILQALRDERRQPTPTEYLAIHLAYNCIGNGKQLTSKSHRPLGSPGFRPHTQTYLSLTDPGDGHVLGTTRFNDWMTGAIVHVEHLEIPANDSQDQIESYRVPSLYDFSRVRLHVGSTASASYFVGRRFKESRHFSDEFNTLINMTSATTSAAFYQGAAECAVTMDGLTTSQAVRYMQELHRQIHRDPFSQYLSASWKINQSLVDDFEKDTPVTLTGKMDIACRVIEATCNGGFDKIIWDGTEDSQATKSIFKQLSVEETISLVHEARSKGLITHFTAGVEMSEIKFGVYSGADSIGIGGSKTLRLPLVASGGCAPYMEEEISNVIKERNLAAGSVCGAGAHLLARLDTMRFEGSISSTENGMRCQLYNAMINHDDSVTNCILEKMDYILKLPCEYGLPLLGEARRLVDSKSPMLKEVAGSFYEWVLFITRLRTLLEKNDVKSVMEDYAGEPWLTLRKKHLETTKFRDQAISRRDGQMDTPL